MINIIAAVGKNLELGKDNKLIWYIPEDLKYFKEVTTKKTVVMGRRTYESIGKPLPNRKNIVLTKQNIKIDNVTIIHDYKEIINEQEDVFIIGGETVYKLFLPLTDNIYLTEIEEVSEADSYFPIFDKKEYKKEIIKKGEFNNINYSFVVYKKIKQK